MSDSGRNANDWPFVTVVIPMRNEERYIAGCLDSILANDYPKHLLEILVIDDGSTDHSKEIVEDYAKRNSFIRLLDNPKRGKSSALNLGIREAKGQIIIRMDAHTLYAPDYIRLCVELLESTQAANVGGIQRAIGTDYITDSIAIAVTTPFGTGDAYYRYADKEMWVDTVYLGAWRKETLVALGGFDEQISPNQDYELNYRLRRAGGRILLSPRIRCWYYVRPTLGKLAQQYFRYGYWKVHTLARHPDSLRWRQLVPPALVVSLLLSLGALPVSWVVALVAPTLYLGANFTASIWAAARRGWKYLPLLPIVFATIHLSWGIGFLTGLFKWGVPRITLRSLVKAFRGVYDD